MLVVSIVGFIAWMIVSPFVFDDYDGYGEVPIPGSRTLHLPKGDVTISFNTQVIGGMSGGQLPIPLGLEVAITPPQGIADPDLVNSTGGTTSVNNDARRQVWVAHIPETSGYTIKADGNVNGFIDPQLSFGSGSKYGFLPWLFVGLFTVSLLALLALALTRPRRQEVRPMTTLEKLTKLSSLHDLGALTDEEYEAEKRRLLDRL